MSDILTKNQQEEFYNEIVRLYDNAEKIIENLSSPGVTDRDRQIKMLTPVLEEISKMADVMGEVYIKFIENGEEATKGDIEAISTAVRHYCIAIKDYTDELKQKPLH